MPRVAGVATKTPRKPIVLDTTEDYKKKFTEQIKPAETEIKPPEEKPVCEPLTKPDIKPDETSIKPDTKPITKPDEDTSKKTFKELQSLFGTGFTESEYREMYDRLMELANNYPMERTAMHKEALVTYIKYAFKRDKAIAEDDIDAADKWGKLASKQANDAKINPNQLSAADLSEGMTSFSQLSTMVERHQDIIPLLNTFIEKPQDRVDYTIWQYVNYCRHLEGKPLIQYRDLYLFLQKRFDENKNKYSFLKDEGDGDFDRNDLGGE